MADEDQLLARLARMQKPVAGTPWWRRMALPAGMLATGLAGGAYVATVQPAERTSPPPMQTSEVSEFQDDSGLAGFTVTENEPLPVTTPATVVTRTEVQTVTDPQAKTDADAARAALEKARADLQKAQAELAAARANPSVDTAQLDALRAEMQQLRDDMAGKDQALDELTRNNMRLQTELETAAQMAGQAQMEADMEAQRLAALEQRRAELEAQRAQEQALLEARTRSAKVIRFGSDGGGGAEGDSGSDEQLDAAERFRRAGRTEAVQAKVIGEPSRTVLQGTLIEATLTNAISSQLEGNVSATVSYDVWSMDMANVLIPRGSRLFGRYSSSIDKGQRRIMVAWDRVVTPDGQSVELAAYGTDRIGRSGVTGRVNTHTLARFSAAAAVSIIGAAPAVLAAAVEKDSDDEVAQDTAENIGTNASDTVGSIMKDYIDIPTTISVDQGAVVMVMVNADLEML
ncbi:TrbI/VirB10 family protein [Paracoccus chinensis]|uniref:Type IV secretion system protein VirB10 n=1 Tax=Paracoccus chinensis TaxID=525640 RepID=A0A1G9MSG7_9RHOB|nr:TrbI/VirB10 family protein [Paracoccus chinensis]SDL76847.1 type IV secretion system protein VirB10 [Paracoccus chinensis]